MYYKDIIVERVLYFKERRVSIRFSVKAKVLEEVDWQRVIRGYELGVNYRNGLLDAYNGITESGPGIDSDTTQCIASLCIKNLYLKGQCKYKNKKRNFHKPSGLSYAFDQVTENGLILVDTKGISSPNVALPSFSPSIPPDLYVIVKVSPGNMGWNGDFSIWIFPGDEALSWDVNKHEKFCDHQIQKRRPRLNMKKKFKQIPPVFKGNIYERPFEVLDLNDLPVTKHVLSTCLVSDQYKLPWA
jgi:hypothetical protein